MDEQKIYEKSELIGTIFGTICAMCFGALGALIGFGSAPLWMCIVVGVVMIGVALWASMSVQILVRISVENYLFSKVEKDDPIEANYWEV